MVFYHHRTFETLFYLYGDFRMAVVRPDRIGQALVGVPLQFFKQIFISVSFYFKFNITLFSIQIIKPASFKTSRISQNAGLGTAHSFGILLPWKKISKRVSMFTFLDLY